MVNMRYHFKIHKEVIGYSAQCIELPGCITQGDTMQELQKNMRDALNLYIEEPEDSKDLAALPKLSIRRSRNIIKVPVDPQIAFAFLLRSARIKHGLTQQEVAKRMGFRRLYSYQRLEAAKVNPGLKMLYKIKQVFPDFSIDYALSVN